MKKDKNGEMLIIIGQEGTIVPEGEAQTGEAQTGDTDGKIAPSTRGKKEESIMSSAVQQKEEQQGNISDVDFMSAVKNVESSDNYGSLNIDSTATGAYQFMWSLYGPEITDITGLDREGFLESKKAQDEFMTHMINNPTTIKPTSYKEDVSDLRKEYTDKRQGDAIAFVNSLRDDEIMALIHFAGRQGARKIMGGVRDGEDYIIPGKNKTWRNYLVEYNKSLPKKYFIGGLLGMAPMIGAGMGIGKMIKNRREKNQAQNRQGQIADGSTGGYDMYGNKIGPTGQPQTTFDSAGRQIPTVGTDTSGSLGTDI